MRVELTPLQARLAQHLTARNPRIEDDDTLIRAAVAVVFAPDPDAILFIRRAERADDPWSGHMSFPGGRSDEGDGDLLATAIRETKEEVGVLLRSDQLVGALDDVAPRRTQLPPIMVRPYVFVLDRRPALVLNQEVAEAVWAPVHELLRPEAYYSMTRQVGEAERSYPAYRLGQRVVWGMTERIVTPLLALLST
ncbi:MAG: CoA pyrophosphatase [Gemmatimonadales bacterium]|nr:CoA pyrophosphatase [Gemmatimonadales bacterium]